jgi:CRISPR/Cas system CMR subunit Cmr6 (Cas7 group RAMP superfamily)
MRSKVRCLVEVLSVPRGRPYIPSTQLKGIADNLEFDIFRESLIDTQCFLVITVTGESLTSINNTTNLLGYHVCLLM